MRSLGHQIIAEFYDCNRDSLNDVEFIRTAMVAAAEKAGATIVTEIFHHFSPHGVSSAGLLPKAISLFIPGLSMVMLPWTCSPVVIQSPLARRSMN